jgi:hypothetical protein
MTSEDGGKRMSGPFFEGSMVVVVNFDLQSFKILLDEHG